MGQSKALLLALNMMLMVGCQSTALADSEGADVVAEDEQNVDGEEVEVETVYQDPRDPFESFNRAMWKFNYGFLEPVFVRPVVHVYDDYIPEPVKDSLTSFFDNFNSPFSAVNHLLQGKSKAAGTEVLRFSINTTVGIVGLFDVASDMGIPTHHQEEFGEVMHMAGVPQGPYLMLPVIGPTTLRDGAGDYVDRLYFPYALLNPWQSLGRWTLDNLNDRSRVRDQEGIIDNALDPYSFTKDAYFQLIEYDVNDGTVVDPETDSDELLDDYLDEID